jgi:carbamoyltransferase
MNILGVHIGHDSSAALIIDGRVVADVAEERFSRIKHDSGLPIKSIEYCLVSQGLSIDDVDIIAVPAQGSVPELNFLFDLKGSQAEQFTTQRRMLEFTKRILNKPAAKPPLYIKNFPVSSKTEIVHVEHHLAHASSAYFSNGLKEKQLIVTMDGAGDGHSICLWRGENGKITPIEKMPVSSSIGWFYSNVTEALGWWHGDGEGKTMGLAPYGDYKNIKGVLEKYHPKFQNGQLVESHNFDRVYFWNQKGAIQFHFDEAYEIQKLIEKYGRENIAAEAQRVLEEQSFELIFPWMEKEGTKNLTSAGGVFLNVKLNQRLWETGKIKNHHIYPNAGDSGLAVGAALYAYYSNNPGAEIHHIEHLYTGPEYTNDEIEETLKLRNLKYKKVENIEEFAAQKLAEDKIVAWFQGRMESGPRALGNRSILMSSNRAENKDIINARVKFREAFRPFCPSLLSEKRDDYLENSRDEDYMITSFTCKEGKRDKVPAVVHADSTLRPQTVKKSVNKKYWNVINEFGKLTDEYLVLNTSFNLMGEPIINQPREAIKCFYDNGLDVLALGNYVLEKE